MLTVLSVVLIAGVAIAFFRSLAPFIMLGSVAYLGFGYLFLWEGSEAKASRLGTGVEVTAHYGGCPFDTLIEIRMINKGEAWLGKTDLMLRGMHNGKELMWKRISINTLSPRPPSDHVSSSCERLDGDVRPPLFAEVRAMPLSKMTWKVEILNIEEYKRLK